MCKAFLHRDGAAYLLAMTLAGMTGACMLTTGATVPEAALPKENPPIQPPKTALPKDNPPVQPPILCEADQSALAESADCLQHFQGLAAREGDVLRLNRENGKSQVYTGNRKACGDDLEHCAIFRLAAFYPTLQSFLVDAIDYNCGHYELVSRRSGSIVKLSDASVPQLSPAGKYIVSVDRSDACDRPYEVAIWSTRTDPPVQELKYEAKRYENWTVAAWAGDERIKFTVFTNDRDGSYDQDAEVVRSGKGWKLVMGKKVKREVVPRKPSP